MEKKTISVVAPVYNEENSIGEFYDRLWKVLQDCGYNWEMVFINDGSADQSMDILRKKASEDRRIKVISLSRNFGHQLAVTAGLDFCCGDCAVIIDTDLQDPPELIPDLITNWRDNYQVVYARRQKRKGETIFKRATAAIFYRILKRFTDFDIPLDTGDFRLIDRCVINTIKSMPERSRFIRGMVSWSGFRQTGINYTRDNRFSGETKYPLFKMLRFALTGLTSFSFIPLQLASYFGFLVSGFSFLYAAYVLYLKFFTTKTIQGWTSLMIAVLFLGGIQLITLGIIGEYIGRMSEEIKRRPAYVIDEKVNIDTDE